MNYSDIRLIRLPLGMQREEYFACLRNLKAGDIIHLIDYNRSFKITKIIHNSASYEYKLPVFWVDEQYTSASEGLINYHWNLFICSAIQKITKVK